MKRILIVTESEQESAVAKTLFRNLYGLTHAMFYKFQSQEQCIQITTIDKLHAYTCGWHVDVLINLSSHQLFHDETYGIVYTLEQATKRVEEEKREKEKHAGCEKCQGDGWVWGKELDNPSEDCWNDDNRYLCDWCYKDDK